MAVLVGSATVGLTPTPASACSFSFLGRLAVEGRPQAGGTLSIAGSGFVAIDGELTAGCGGDYAFVPADPVRLVVDFATLSGPRSVVVVATPTGPRIPHEQAEPGFDDAFGFKIEAAIPTDATAVQVRAQGLLVDPVSAAISGAGATTVPVAPPEAAPALAETGKPTFTG